MILKSRLLFSLTMFFTASSIFAQTGTLTIKTISLPSALPGVQYDSSIEAVGGSGSYLWNVTSGSLPPGLKLVESQCFSFPCQAPVAISGVPTQNGLYTFTITVSILTQVPKDVAAKTFSINVSNDVSGSIKGCTGDLYQFGIPTTTPGVVIRVDGQVVPLDQNGTACYQKLKLSPGLHQVTSSVPDGYTAYYWSCTNCPVDTPPTIVGHSYEQAQMLDNVAYVTLDVPKNGNVVLWWRYFPPSPIGWLDSFIDEKNTTGWVVDPDSPLKPVEVNFYVDGPSGSGLFAGTQLANLSYSDVEMPFPGFGFYWTAPSRFMDGLWHSLYVYGIDTQTKKEYVLTRVPRMFRSNPTGPLPGDINLDHIVNSIDWSIMSSNWMTNNIDSDLNRDGLVNTLDFSILSSNWLKTW